MRKRPMSDQPPIRQQAAEPTKNPDPWRVEGARNNAPGNGQPRIPGLGGPPSRQRWRRPLTFFLVALILNQLFYQVLRPEPKRVAVPYTTFLVELEKGNVKEVTSVEDRLEGVFAAPVTFEKQKSEKFRSQRPSFADDELLDRLIAKGVAVNAHPPDSGPGLLSTLLFSFGPTFLIVGLFVMMARKAAGGAMGGIGGLGKSRATRYEQTESRTTFEDVAGIDDAEDELVELVDFLRNPAKYKALGAAIPKGVLLSGSPGTGKTLLARAVAGEANVPFFHISASEFIEMIVGVGASRVRDLFAQAKAAAPAIIFIDEIDAIGRSRGGSASMGGHDEREQTLNQILVEMDGFSGTEGVIVLAATNRPEILDSALLRPGRFDRRIAVSPPDQVGREQILRVHTKSVPLNPEVDLGALASSTPGMVGADLKNMINEAALLAAKRGHESVSTADFTDSLEKIILGTERRLVISYEERKRTAFHESGHALLGMLEPGADPVRKISIVPRGNALGVTLQSPEADRYSYGANYLRGRIVGALGGRAAEEVVYGDVTTGAESDLEMVNRIARQMVGRWGMSEAIGPLAVMPNPSSGPMFGDGPDSPSERTRELIDSESRRIVEECYERALGLLREHRAQLDALTEALLDKETLDQLEAYAAVGIPSPEKVSLQGR